MQTIQFILFSALAQTEAIGAYTFTFDRFWASLAAILALAGAILGGLALARSARGIGPGQGRRGARVALVAGVISVVIGGLLLATADGGPGTGNGVVGAGVAVVLGVIGLAEGGLVLARARRTG